MVHSPSLPLLLLIFSQKLHYVDDTSQRTHNVLAAQAYYSEHFYDTDRWPRPSSE